MCPTWPPAFQRRREVTLITDMKMKRSKRCRRRGTIKPRQVTLRGQPKWEVRYRAARTEVRRYFDTQGEAETFAGDSAQRLKVEGRAAMKDMPPRSRLDAIRARELLPKGVSLEDAARFYVQHHVVAGHPLTFDDLVDRFIEDKRKKSRANSEWPDILGDILRPFREEMGRREVVSILERDVTDVLGRLAEERAWKATTCKQRLVVLKDLFSLGVGIGAANINPADKVQPPVAKDPDGPEKDVAIVSPHTVRGILAVSGDLTPAVSISFFGGLRNREVQRLDWSEIDLDRRRIEVRDGNSKTGQARWVDIADNLAAFLLPYRRASGPVVPKCFRTFSDGFRAVRKRAGVTKWVRGTARHCFASYYLFAGHKIDDLIRNMGHVDDVMIYTHYRELVTPEDAVEFWQILPNGDVMMAA